MSEDRKQLLAQALREYSTWGDAYIAARAEVVSLSERLEAATDLLRKSEKALFHSELQTAGQLSGAYGGDVFVPAGLAQVRRYREDILLPVLAEVRAALAAAGSETCVICGNETYDGKCGVPGHGAAGSETGEERG